MSKSRNKYRIICASNKIEKTWDALGKEFPDRVSECKEFLINNPEDRRKATGRLKKLQGRFKGTLQYDVTKDDARVWYRVDRKEKLVIIKYAGHHPDKY